MNQSLVANGAVRRAVALTHARWCIWRQKMAERGIARSLGPEEGQSTLEYALIIAAISVPLSMLLWYGLRTLLDAVVRVIVDDFTNGPTP